MEQRSPEIKLYKRFEGEAVSISLHTVGNPYVVKKNTGDMIEQHLDVKINGEGILKTYYLNEKKNKCLKEKRPFMMDALLTNAFFAKFQDCFSIHREYPMNIELKKHKVYWKLTMKNSLGEVFEFMDSFCIGAPVLCELSFFVRRSLYQKDLWLFDWDTSGDRPVYLGIVYRKARKTRQGEDVYLESLKLFREGMRVAVKCEHEDGESVNFEVQPRNAVAVFLNLINQDNAEDLYPVDLNTEQPEECGLKKMYYFVLEYESGKKFEAGGIFSRDTLPHCWSVLTKRLSMLLKEAPPLEILDQRNFSIKYPKDGDRMYCYVRFIKNSQQEYVYLCDDMAVDIGDAVLVPVGDGDGTTVCYVTRIEFLPDDEAPYPLDKINTIKKRCDD